MTRALPGASRALRGRWLPYGVFLGFLVLAGYMAAHLTWQFAGGGGGQAASAPASPAHRPGGNQPDQGPADKVAAAHLFGTASAKSRRQAAADAPETSLDLSLLGVAAGTSGAPSQAIISSGSNGQQDTYAVGATLPGGAVIRQILPDRVVIAHDGRLESLRLPVVGTSLLAAHMSFGNGQGSVDTGGGKKSGGKAGPSAPPGPSPAKLRHELKNNPKSVSDYMRLRPYAKGGHLKGYRVYPGKFPKLFQNSGLKPGDIVTQVNGIDLDNPKANMRAMSQIKKANGPVHLVVQRGGKSVHVTVQIPGG